MKTQVNLKNLTTFGINVITDSYLEVGSENELIDLIKEGKLKNKELIILGGGSNLLFRNDFSGLVIKPVFDEIKLLEEDSDSVVIECEAGHDWDSFVEYCVNNSYGGLENLSYIPGNVGAAPIQNIGAYGCEVCSLIKEVNTVSLETGEKMLFTRDMCEFDYRSSIFKKEYKGKLLISSVKFLLNKKPSFNTSYGVVNERVDLLGGPCLKNIREAIISIRKEKLPEPDEIGNAGSFFKNPVISKDHFDKICHDHEQVPSYPAPGDMVKVPAGWLIEQCGWKGYRRGDAGVHTRQALVLVNYGNASGIEIYNLSKDIINSVLSKFGIALEREVNVI